jgi:restriction system protein
MITTSGYGPDSYKFAGGKPLNLIDGSGLLALCQEYEIPARHPQSQQEEIHRLIRAF